MKFCERSLFKRSVTVQLGGLALRMNGSVASALLPERAYTEVCSARTLIYDHKAFSVPH